MSQLIRLLWHQHLFQQRTHLRVSRAQLEGDMVGENNLPAAELMGAGQVAETEQLEPPAGLSIAGVVQKGAVVGEAAGEVVDQTLDFDVIAQGQGQLVGAEV